MIQRLTQDWGLKVVSLILAIGLWFYAVGEESVEVTRRIPLEIKLKNDRMSILRASAKSVLVTLTAPRALLSDLTSEKIMAVHDIGSEVKTSGDYSFRLEPGEIKLGTPQIRVSKIEPGIIQATLDELIVKKLAVEPHFVGEPAFGYRVYKEEVQLDPNAILIEGPKGELEKLGAVKTERIELVGRSRAFRRTVKLEYPPNLKPLSEPLIDAYIPIKEEFEEKAFEEVPVRVLKSPDKEERVQIEPPHIAFTLKGSKRQLEKLAPQKILAYIDAGSLSEGEHEIPVEIILPEDVGLKAEGPILVKAVVKK